MLCSNAAAAGGSRSRAHTHNRRCRALLQQGRRRATRITTHVSISLARTRHLPSHNKRPAGGMMMMVQATHKQHPHHGTARHGTTGSVWRALGRQALGSTLAIHTTCKHPRHDTARHSSTTLGGQPLPTRIHIPPHIPLGRPQQASGRGTPQAANPHSQPASERSACAPHAASQPVT